MSSCRTLGEGIDTRLANLAMFADAKTTWWAIVQAVGRITRRNRQIDFTDDESTVVLPVFVNAEQYAACDTAEKRDDLLRETVGNFETLRNFLAALEQSDPELLALIRDNRWSPKEVKDNAKKQDWIVSEEMSLQEALQNLLKTDIDYEIDLDDVAADHDVRIAVHTDLMDEPERFHGDGPEIHLLELRDGDAYCTLTQMKRKRNSELKPLKKRSMLEVDCPLQWSLDYDGQLGSCIMKYTIKEEWNEKRIAQLHAFYALHRTSPKSGGKHHENEKVLATWIRNRRRDKKTNKNPELCDRVEREFTWWSWDPIADQLEEAIAQLHAFYALHGTSPKNYGKRENEAVLATWINNHRWDKKTNKNSELCDRLEREFTWWRWVPVADQHEERIAQLHAFYALHGTSLKECGKRENESILTSWIRNRRQDKKTNLNPELCDRVEREFTWWSWDPFADHHEERIAQIHAFYALHGTSPKNCGKRENDAVLGTWISNRRKDKKTNKNPELCDRLEREFPWWSWDPIADQYEETIAQLHAFYALHGTYPKKGGKRENEKVLATWINNRRTDKKKNVNPELSDRVEREFTWWSWDPLADQYEEANAQLHAFYALHGTYPKKGGKRENEAVLGTWINNRRQDKKRNLNSELSDRLEREFTWIFQDLSPPTVKPPSFTLHQLRAPPPLTPACDLATDYATMTIPQWHQKAFTMRSETLGAIFAATPAAWSAYHDTRHLDYDPLQLVITEMEKVRHCGFKIVADLGCGNATLGRHFHGDVRFKILGFDHVGIDTFSRVCDISRCELLDDNSVHLAVLCLALWGSNKDDTLRAAHRILETNGVLYLVEPSRRWTADPTPELPDPEPSRLLLDLVHETGFSVLKSTIHDGARIFQFTFLILVKT